jgi:ABC-type transport system substrate-binding protein
MIFSRDNMDRLGASLRATALCLITLAPLAAADARATADPGKIIHSAIEAADDGFDPALTFNLYSGRICEAILERLLTYDYLARPAKLVPLTAEAMPEVADGGKTYTFKIRKGIYFATDPAFKGARRELTAQDYAYTFKRFLDPVNRSPSANMLEGKIVGLDAVVAQAKKSGKFDYDAPVAGLQTPDRYTLTIRLNQPDYNFLYVAAYGNFGAVAREVIETYRGQTRAHPVGTGPYMLKEYVPRSKIDLQANPDYRGFVWNFAATGDARDEQLVRDMKGKQMPQAGRVEISIIEEEQSRWLAFEGGQLDFDMLPQIAAPVVMDGPRLKPEYASQGIDLYRTTEPEVIYYLFNMRDPVLGGYTQERIALRRAIAMAYNVHEEIVLVRKSQAVKAEMVVPEGVVGHDEKYRSSIAYDISLANALLDSFNFKRGADGYRSFPDGKPLLVELRVEQTSVAKLYGEIWKRGLDQLGVRLNITVSNFADNLKAATECKLAMWGAAWYADFPEAENFLQLLYGPNVLRGNHGCYESAAFDELYRTFSATPPGAERNRLVIEMNRQQEADTAWVIQSTRLRNWLSRPWLKGFKRHPILQSDWQYLDVEKH